MIPSRPPAPPPPPRRRTPFSLLPLLMLISAGILWVMIGCNPVGGFLSGPEAEQARQTVAEDQITRALTALNGGDAKGAGIALDAAAHVLTEPGQPPGVAYAAVARRLTRVGQAAAAAKFLSDALASPPLADFRDPVIYAALADADTEAGNAAAAAQARQTGDGMAARIVQYGGGMSSSAGGDDAATKALRLIEAGRYYALPPRRDLAHALPPLRAAEKLAPDDPDVLTALGYTLADLGTTQKDWDNAKIVTREAVHELPNRPDILDAFGWALFHEKDYQGARRILDEAADLVGDNPTVRYHLGAADAALGEKADSARELNLALQIDPHFGDADRARELLGTLRPLPRP